MKKKVFVSTFPFAKLNKLPLEIINSANIDVTINPLNRRLTGDELEQFLSEGYDYLIAGTEPITNAALGAGSRLKLVSRVGIGLDNLDLNFARRNGIQVSYTPEAPAPAVAELTIGLMLCLLRGIHLSHSEMKNSNWVRHFGRRISEVTVGIIGAGRVGGRVLRRLAGFGTPRVLVNDTVKRDSVCPSLRLEWTDKETIYREADVISLHVPLTSQTRNMVGRDQIEQMKRDVCLINTARGGIINETDLADALRNGLLNGGVALDVFGHEPYIGPLKNFDNVLLTAHMGSMSIDCRSKMEIEASEDIVNFNAGRELVFPVPDFEYGNQGR